MDVTAIDCEPACVEALKSRGINSVELADITTYQSSQRFRTILFLHSTFGLTGNVDDVGALLAHLRTLLTDDGIVLVQDVERPVPIHAFQAQFIYRNDVGHPFQWLNYSFTGLRQIAQQHGWSAEKLVRGPGPFYIAALRPSGGSAQQRPLSWLTVGIVAFVILLVAATLLN